LCVKDGISKRIRAAGNPDRIAGEIAAGGRIVVTLVVVVEPGLAVEVLAGETEIDGPRGQGRRAGPEGLAIPSPDRSACFTGADPRRAQVVGMQVGDDVAGIDLRDRLVPGIEVGSA
jgi:hypothetical protein